MSKAKAVLDSTTFIHDQRRSVLFTAEMVDFYPLEDLKNVTKYGKSLSGYVYK